MHTHTHTNTYRNTHRNKHTHTTAVLPLVEDLRMTYYVMLLDLMLFSVEFHIMERNDELSHFLSLGKRQEWRALWLGYSLFHDQKLLHCKGDVTRRMYMGRYQNVEQHFGAHGLMSIRTNYQKFKIIYTIHSLCYWHKKTQIFQKQAAIDICFANINWFVAII